jgi:hypothetical protein
MWALSVIMAAPAHGADSGATLWTALGGNVVCGLAIHPPGTPPERLLCSSPVIPTARTGFGDGGNVFLGSEGRPALARLSQDTFAGAHEVKLTNGTTWTLGELFLFCRVSEKRVRCENEAHHGFTITLRSYHSF